MRANGARTDGRTAEGAAYHRSAGSRAVHSRGMGVGGSDGQVLIAIRFKLRLNR